MDHIVCLDEGANELDNLVSGSKTMILRGDDDYNLHFVHVRKGDMLYFAAVGSMNEVKAKGRVSSVHYTGRITAEESFETIIRNQARLQLPDNQFYAVAGKKYLLLIGVENIELIKPFGLSGIVFADSGLFSLENIDVAQAQGW